MEDDQVQDQQHDDEAPKASQCQISMAGPALAAAAGWATWASNPIANEVCGEDSGNGRASNEGDGNTTGCGAGPHQS